MPIDLDEGVNDPLSTQELLERYIEELQARLGETLDVTPGSPERALMEALVAGPASEVQQDIDNLVAQYAPRDATGNFLDRHLSFHPGVPRLEAKFADGNVEISFQRVQDSPDPLFESGSLTFEDVDGNLYDLISDVPLPAAVFDSDESGTNSEAVDGSGNTRIAQKVSWDTREFVQAFEFKAIHNSGTPEFTVRLETHDSTNDEPSGTLVDSRLEETGIQPADDTLEGHVWTEGAYVDAGTYWLVIEQTQGSADFDGGTGGTADQVKVFDGTSWTLDSNVENLNLEVIQGGVADVEAREKGFQGNIDAGKIDTVQFNDATTSDRWNSEVESFKNNDAFSGGRTRESDREYFTRARAERASRPSPTTDGLAKAVEDAVDGVIEAENIENHDSVIDDRFTVYEETGTGSSSTTIGSTTTRIAQRINPDNPRFVQKVNLKLASDSDLVGKVRIETDDGGSPSGTLADGNLETAATGADFDGTNETTFTFNHGALLSADTDYWVVFERDSGSGQFDGENSSGDNDVQVYDGSWSDSGNLDNVNGDVIAGVRPKGFMVVPQGTFDNDDVAQAIWDNKGAGLASTGKDTGTATDRADESHTIRFETPTNVGVEVDIEVEHTSAFDGSADDVRDIIVDYIAGTNTDGDEVPGDLDLGDTLYRDEIKHRVLDDDNLLATLQVPSLQVARKGNALGTSNLSATNTEQFTIEDAGADIAVTLTEV